jgi:hypothetical protein
MKWVSFMMDIAPSWQPMKDWPDPVPAINPLTVAPWTWIPTIVWFSRARVQLSPKKEYPEDVAANVIVDPLMM